MINVGVHRWGLAPVQPTDDYYISEPFSRWMNIERTQRAHAMAENVFRAESNCQWMAFWHLAIMNASEVVIEWLFNYASHADWNRREHRRRERINSCRFSELNGLSEFPSSQHKTERPRHKSVISCVSHYLHSCQWMNDRWREPNIMSDVLLFIKRHTGYNRVNRFSGFPWRKHSPFQSNDIQSSMSLLFYDHGIVSTR